MAAGASRQRLQIEDPSAKKRSSSARRNVFWVIPMSSRSPASIFSTECAGPSSRSHVSYSPSSAGRNARSVNDEPYLGSTEKLPITRTTPPGQQCSNSSSTRSQSTASTAPVTSPSWSLRKDSPFFFWRRARSRTTKTLSTLWPSARSRTKVFVPISACCSIGNPR